MLAKDLNNISNTQIGCLKMVLRLAVCNLCSESTKNTYFFAKASASAISLDSEKYNGALQHI